MLLIKACESILPRLRDNEHFVIVMNVIKSVTESEAGLPKAIIPLWVDLKKQFEKEDDVFRKNAMAVETKRLVSANKIRSSDYMLFKRAVEAISRSRDEDRRDAATKLVEVLRNYKSIAAVAMNEVTPLVFRMVEDLRSPRYAPAVTLLKLDIAAGNLEAANIAFDNLYIDRGEQGGGVVILGSMREVRPGTDRALITFIDGVNAFCGAERTDDGGGDRDMFCPVIASINGLIDEYDHILAQRTPCMTADGKPTHEDDITLPPGHPGQAPPIFEVVGQRIDDPKTMTLTMDDPATFTATLYPTAIGGVVTLIADPSPDSGHADCPVKAYFEMDGMVPVGLCVAPQEANSSFVSPLESLGDCRAKVIKDGVVLAVLTDMKWPAIEAE
ncbi:MAG: DUF6261 family protein [Tannerellaceae bacterium]|jgi:hypothetical protein|nr:DUF6261 family protein [Tannerellaceae bacterium]